MLITPELEEQQKLYPIKVSLFEEIQQNEFWVRFTFCMNHYY